MLRIIAALLSILLLFCNSVGFAENIDLTTMSEDALYELRTAIDNELAARQASASLESGILAEGDIDEYHIAILSAKSANDYSGTPGVIVTYMFTNNSSKEAMFMSSVSSTVYQNGVQCEVGVFMEGVDGNSSMTKVKPGASVEVTIGYVLRDSSETIDIEVGKLIDFSSNPIKVVTTTAIN